MDFSIASYGFGLLAGLLTTLSPCVLPILPVLLASATAAHARAPLALACGLAISYAIIGTTVAWLGASFAIDAEIFRQAGAILFALFGIVLLSGGLQQKFASSTSAISDAGNNLLNRLNPQGLRGQFITGLLLGVIWSPCVGPTLGGAIVMASQGSNLPQVILLMAIFGFGAGLPVVILSFLSRSAIMRVRDKMLKTGKSGKILLGSLMLLIAILIITGTDKPVEAWLVSISPDWLTRLTTSF